MLSESARMSSAAEARFRVPAPNSLPRAIKVIALDRDGEAVVRRLDEAGWRQASFLLAMDSRDPALRDLSGGSRAVAAEVDTADLVVLVAGPGGRAHTAATIGEACSRRRVMTTGFIVGATAASQRDLSSTLAQLRPWSLMLVVANNDDYIDDMLRALRA
jgi:hypothetical protein